ncbi:MAG TPA: aldehyde dehydrogenase family protein [Solirubrobacteraceae bacterium]|jgi:glyceraldehyde-3-phosphate dehydrogenase (NADP+)|nr:aldehyde dehydrogenase family protein [Solirubrobacteraceae bacterium]
MTMASEGDLKEAVATQANGRSAPRPIYVAGEWVRTGAPLAVAVPTAPDEPFAHTFLAGPGEYERAAAGALAAVKPLAELAAYERGDALRAVSSGILARHEELSRQLAAEAGKPIRDARVEMQRGALAFRLAAEEAERVYGEVMPLDLNAASRGRVAIVRRFPIGAIAAISPFNLPIGLAVHKVAPALAVGCPVVLKPPSATPLTMLSIAELVAETGLPSGSLSVIPMGRDLGDTMVADRRFKLLTFTGSPDVGWALKQRAGNKKVVLELGSNAAAIVDETADIDWAVTRCVYGGFKYAGQLCVSVQRVFVHDSVYDEFVEPFVARTQTLKVGDPLDEGSDVGPMIDLGAARRINAWIDEAAADGASVLLRGATDGTLVEPSILADVPRAAKVWREEAFGPVVSIARFTDISEALDGVNDSRFGLQAGIFTNNLEHAWRAFGELEVGGVIVNDAPTYRIDNMPFGGVKDSGLGREGMRYAIEDMTELRTLVLAGRT